MITPGKWKVMKLKDGYGVKTENGEAVAFCYNWPEFDEYNAYLMTQSPDMLEQLKSMVNAFNEGRLNQDHIATAKDIIAKAEGSI